MSLRDSQEAAYAVAISTARHQQDQFIYQAMKQACDSLEQTVRSECTKVDKALITVSLAGGARRNGNGFFNVISVRNEALGLQVEGEIRAIRDAETLVGLVRMGADDASEFYRNPEGNVAGLLKAFDDEANVFLGNALDGLRRLMLGGQ